MENKFGTDSKYVDANPEYHKAKELAKKQVKDMFGWQVDPFTGKQSNEDFQGLPEGQEKVLENIFKAELKETEEEKIIIS